MLNGNCEHEWRQLDPFAYQYCPKCGAICYSEPERIDAQGRGSKSYHVSYPETAAEFAAAVFKVGNAETDWDKVTIAAGGVIDDKLLSTIQEEQRYGK